MGLSSQAQIPGYHGLRFIVKYNCGLSHPAIFGRSGKLPSITHHGSIDYVLSRYWMLGVDYAFMTYRTPSDRTLIDNKDIDLTGRYTQHVISFTGKYFFKKRGFIAPIGPYVNIGLYYQYVRMYYYSDVYNNNNASMYNRAIAHHGGIVFGMGRNFVVANRMTVDLGFTFNASLPAIDFVNDNGELGLYNEIIFRNFFQLHLGLGILAF